MSQTWIAVAIAVAISSAIYGQIFHDAAGRVTGHARTDQNNVTAFYGPSNRVTGRPRTDSNGTTTFYDPSGRIIGKSRPPALSGPAVWHRLARTAEVWHRPRVRRNNNTHRALH